MPYQVGDLTHFEPDDPTFDTREEADEQAVMRSIDDNIYGIWTSQDEGSELVAIVYQQELFEK